ncbi:MAG TPA: MATE family efflux transporter [Rhodopila sp.]|nr:MATE family efflux transporter [Rhodopila sp.]
MRAMATSTAPPIRAARTRLLLEAPILGTLLRLAAPNLVVMLAQASTGLVETAFVGRLGTDALAGMALVFPGVMLMQMVSGGAMGGGIAAAIARALGAGRRADADALVWHALAINVALALLFMLAGLLGGPALYRFMGGHGKALEAALLYSNILFGGALLLWLMNALASCLRGTGNMVVPSAVICVGAVLLVPLSPLLIFGLGPFPRLGIAGGGVAVLLYYAGGTAVLAWYVRSGRSLVRLQAARLRWAPLWDILRVGLVAALVSVQTQIIVTAATAFVGRFGTGAIAGYGAGARLEYLLIPLVFGLGAPLVALIGTNIGAGQRARAVRVAWIGAGVAFVMTEAIGLAAAAFPAAWLGLFGADPAMLATGSTYLRLAGPFYGFFGLGMAIYFASQGAGRMAWPLTAALLRTLIAVGGGWLALHWTDQPGPVFLALGAGLVTFGVVNALALAAGAWSGTRA